MGKALTIAGIAEEDNLLFVSGAGDVNGDGLTDIIMASHKEDKVYVVFGSSDMRTKTSFDLSTLDGTNGFQVVAGYNDLNNFQQRFLEGGAFLDDDE